MWHVSFSPVLLFHIIHDTNSPPRHQDDIRATLDDIYTTLDDTFFHMNFATFFAEELLFTFSILPYDIYTILQIQPIATGSIMEPETEPETRPGTEPGIHAKLNHKAIPMIVTLPLKDNCHECNDDGRSSISGKDCTD